MRKCQVVVLQGDYVSDLEFCSFVQIKQIRYNMFNIKLYLCWLAFRQPGLLFAVCVIS